jgi:hypothetical protein
MEYMVTSNRPFQDIETQIVDALERRGLGVQCTFSLGSAMARSTGQPEGNPGFSILMLYMPGAQRQPLGLVTLHEREGQLVIHPTLTSQARKDIRAELVAALALAGLDFCVSTLSGGDILAPCSCRPAVTITTWGSTSGPA